jgi:hypothetical protein
MSKNLKYFNTVTVLFVAIILISNVASCKILNLGWFTFDGGTILFPLSYIFGDILTEVYGYARMRKTIWLGFLCAFLMALVFYIVGKLPPAEGWTNQVAYDAILGQTPRIVLASLLAFWCGSFVNSFILAKMKVITAGRWLWMRTIGSTVAGELVDTVIFVIVAFAGTMGGQLLWALIISNYIFKTLVEVVFTPVTYKIVSFLKRSEEEDYYDTNTNFNPFKGVV